MSLSVVVVNWNSGNYLGRCLESLAAGKSPFMVRVVDNASEDGSWRAAQQRSGVELTRLPENAGFAGAVNRALASLSSDFVLLLNPDIEIRPDTVDRLLQAGKSHPQAALCVPLLESPSGLLQSAFQLRRLPTLGSVLSDVLFLDEVLQWLPFRGRQPELYRRRLRVEQPAAACWLLRREAWEDVGGLDERFQPAWFEDVDFCRRMADRGWQALAFPRLRARHAGGHTVARLGKRAFYRLYYRNLLRYWKKHHPRSFPLVWPAVQLGLAVRLILGGHE